MATNLKIDDALIHEAVALSGLHTKKEAVTAALEEYVVRHRQLQILSLEGSIEFDPDYDYKEQRKRP
jgi:Arc/MetJ family transcription regulator